MDGYLLDTSVLSARLDPAHPRHDDIDRVLSALEQSAQFVSAISLAELTFGVRLAAAFVGSASPRLSQILKDAEIYAVLDVTRHTAAAYAELKANLAKKYLASARRRDRPRWVEDWIDKSTGRVLLVDDNDLWMCAQAKERGVQLVTADRMRRIADADDEVRLLVL